MADLGDSIRSIPLFSGLSREDVAKVLGKLEEKFFGPGVTVFSQGDKGDAFYLIESGSVQVVLESAGGRREAVAIFGPQDWFGEMALLSGEPRSATIITISDTAVWRLSREAWDELIEKHPSWLLHFCAELSKRLARIEQQYSFSRDAFNSVAEKFYGSRDAEQQQFLRRASVLAHVDPQIADRLLSSKGARDCLSDLKTSQSPLIRSLEGNKYEFHPSFKEFLREKLLTVEGQAIEKTLHSQVGLEYEKLGEWQQAVHHCLEADEWQVASKLLQSHKEQANDSSALFVKNAVERFPWDYFLADPRLIHLKAECLTRLGDLEGAFEAYKEILSQKILRTENAEAIARYQNMAEAMAKGGEYNQALHCLRSGLSLVEQDAAINSGNLNDAYRRQRSSSLTARQALPKQLPAGSARVVRTSRDWSVSRWIGGILGLATWTYLWFWTPDIGLDPSSTKQLALLFLTLIFWIFWVFPDYGVALIFALGLILTGLAKAEVVLGGFASTSWFMTLGVLGLGAAITSSGLFYRLSLQLVRVFPLNYHWQVVALGFMGIVVMALIPQQSARTAIISQMLINLSESLGYKNPSKASTGLFVASFLGLGQLGFLFLTGSTTSLIAWGLLRPDVRSQFTWGYWFIAALPPALIVAAIVLVCTLLLRPESRPQISYRMVDNQLGILGPLSKHEWVTLVVLCMTIVGWLTTGFHKIDGAWISLAALCVLVNTGVLGWGMMKKGIDWEMLICMGVTLAIPALLTEAKIDKWLVGLLSPLILPYVENLALCFAVIALITYAIKLFFTSFLTVIAATVALLPFASEMGVNPWVVVMIVLIASEVWFFPFQVDWHTLAYSTTDGKGFTYPLMCRIGPVYALAYLLALVAAIPYWRFLGLIR